MSSNGGEGVNTLVKAVLTESKINDN